MKKITLEWISKAEADFATAQREIDVAVDPNYDAVCFHSQQSVEKYMKARLQEAEITFIRTHDLTVLLDSLLDVEPEWEELRSDLNSLTAFAVDYRYPGEAAELAEATEALNTCRKVRSLVRIALGLEALPEV